LTGEEIKKVMNGDPPFSDDEDKDDGSASAPSVTAIPKTKPKAKPSGTMEPEPS
jgi:cell division protease FtsH